MRVVCIGNAKSQYGPSALLKKGNVYTVLDVEECKSEIRHYRNEIFRLIEGTYYTLVELGNGVAYHSSLFQVINEDQQDETEFERAIEKEVLTK